MEEMNNNVTIIFMGFFISFSVTIQVVRFMVKLFTAVQLFCSSLLVTNIGKLGPLDAKKRVPVSRRFLVAGIFTLGHDSDITKVIE